MKNIKFELSLTLGIGLVVIAIAGSMMATSAINTWKDIQRDQLKERAIQGCIETSWNEYTTKSKESLVRVLNEDGVKKCLSMKGY